MTKETIRPTGSSIRHSSFVTRHSTVGEAVQWAAAELSAERVEPARMTGELLLAHILRWTRVRVITHPEEALSAEQADRFRSLVRRRCSGEPLQYITGEREFYGLSFKVTPSVLIPRPETELLTGEVLRLSKSLPHAGEVRFADVGTGSGCIAISLLHNLPGWRAWAIDISRPALEVARLNAERMGVNDRIRFVCADMLECFAARPTFDFIVSNPPYGARGDMESVQAMVRDYEPDVAVFGGESGYEAFSRLIPQAKTRLVTGGRLVLEVGFTQSEQVARNAEREGFVVERVVEDLQGIPRCIVARKETADKRR
jgi:release factor glutamine methyltransferase